MDDAATSLIEAQKNYIQFLTEHIGKHIGFLRVHGVLDTEEEINEGKRLRAEIEEAEKKYNDVKS